MAMSTTELKNTDSFTLVYEDEDIVVVDKKSGVSVLPERWEKHVPNLLEQASSRWPGISAVHRIDKETSGLLLLAKTAVAARELQIGFEEHRIGKIYHALVNGRPSWDNLVCEAAVVIDGDRHHRTVIARGGDPEAKKCVSRFVTLERFRGCSLVGVELQTGRTHQIRAHASHLGHPLIGDHLYGGPAQLLLSTVKAGWRGDRFEERPLIERVALHAFRLHFEHPLDKRMLEFTAEYPKDFRATLNQLRRWA
jgi:RluA family pseudouridine synthase